jgi:hypothetical protein
MRRRSAGWDCPGRGASRAGGGWFRRWRAARLRWRRLTQYALAGLGPPGRQERRVAPGQVAHALLEGRCPCRIAR